MTDVKKQKIKKISGIVLNVLIWAFVVFSVLVTVLVFAAQGNKDGVPSLFGKSFITIESPSMTGTLDMGDLVFMERLDEEDKRELEAGDIITYRAPIDINGDGMTGDLNTHRIVSHDTVKGIFVTQGDNEPGPDSYTIGYNDIIGECEEDEKIAGLGNVIKFLRSPLGFFLCIVLPLMLFFLYELYNFISILVTERAKRNPVSKETEEEIKRRAIEEYIRSQEASNTSSEAKEEPILKSDESLTDAKKEAENEEK